MTCHFEYNQEDAAALMWRTARTAPVGAALTRQLRWLPLRSAAVAWCMVFVVIAAMLAIRHPSASAARLLTITAAGATFGVLVAAILSALKRLAGGGRLQDRLVQQAIRRGLLPVQRGVFSAGIEDGWVRLCSERTEDAICVDAIDDVVREDGQIYIILDDAVRMQIPERGFESPDECEAFCQELQAGAAPTAGA